MTDKIAFLLWGVFGALALAPIAADVMSPRFHAWVRRDRRVRWRACWMWSATWYVPTLAMWWQFSRG